MNTLVALGAYHDLKILVPGYRVCVPVGFQCLMPGPVQVTSSRSGESGLLANKTSLTKKP